MIAYLVLGIALVGMLGGGYMYVRNSGVESCRLEQAQKDAELAEMQRQWAASEQARLDAAVAARAKEQDEFNKGLAKGKALTIAAQRQVADDVAKYPVLTDPRCAIPADVVRHVNEARRGPGGVFAAAAARGTAGPAGVPAAGALSGSSAPAGGSDAADGGGRGDVLPVQGSARPTGGVGETGSAVLPAAKGHAPSPIKR